MSLPPVAGPNGFDSSQIHDGLVRSWLPGDFDPSNSESEGVDSSDGPPSPRPKVSLRDLDHIFVIFQKKVEGYINLGAKTIKITCSVLVIVESEAASHVSKVVAFVGLISIVKILGIARTTPKKISHVVRSFKLPNVEGILYTSFECLRHPFRFTKSVITFGKSLRELGGVAWVVPLLPFSSAVSLVCLVFETAHYSYKIVVLFVERSKLNALSDENIVEEFRDYLDQSLSLKREDQELLRRDVETEIPITKYECGNEPEAVYPTQNENIRIVGDDLEAENALTLAESIYFKGVAEEFKNRTRPIKEGKKRLLKQRTDDKIVDYMENIRESLIAAQARSFPPEQVEGFVRHAIEDLQYLQKKRITVVSIKLLFCIGEGLLKLPAFVFNVPEEGTNLLFSALKAVFAFDKEIRKHRKETNVHYPDHLNKSKNEFDVSDLVYFNLLGEEESDG